MSSDDDREIVEQLAPRIHARDKCADECSVEDYHDGLHVVLQELRAAGYTISKAIPREGKVR